MRWCTAQLGKPGRQEKFEPTGPEEALLVEKGQWGLAGGRVEWWSFKQQNVAAVSWILISYCKVVAQTSAGVRGTALDVTQEQSLGQDLRSSADGPLL